LRACIHACMITRHMGKNTPQRLTWCACMLCGTRALQARWQAKCDWLKCIGSAIVKGIVGVAAVAVSYCVMPVVFEHRWSTLAAFTTTFLHSNSLRSGASVSGVKRRDMLWLGCLLLCVPSVAAQDTDDEASSASGSAMAEVLAAAAGAMAGGLASGASKKMRKGTMELVSREPVKFGVTPFTHTMTACMTY
jgi:hypothetical protein